MAKIHSFEAILATICATRKPKSILEWGPGSSTVILAKALPDTPILSIEHDPIWYQRTVAMASSFKNVEIVLVKHTLTHGESQGYVTYPLRRAINKDLAVPPYDFIFVDGRSRCDCLTIAKLLLTDDGLVLLHDSSRVNYHPGLQLYPHVKTINKADLSLASNEPIDISGLL